jgi:hypothetical protein
MTNKMQLCGTIYCPLIALHVSSDIIAPCQELLNCIFTASDDTYVCHCLLVSWENQNSNSPTTPAGSDVFSIYLFRRIIIHMIADLSFIIPFRQVTLFTEPTHTIYKDKFIKFLYTL